MVGGGASFITHSRGCVSLERLTYCFSASQPAVHRAQYLQCTATRPISGTCVLTSKASTVLRKSLPAGLVERPLIGPARNAIATPCATPPGSCSFDVSFRGYRPRKRRGLNPRLLRNMNWRENLQIRRKCLFLNKICTGSGGAEKLIPVTPAGAELRAFARKSAVELFTRMSVESNDEP